MLSEPNLAKAGFLHGKKDEGGGYYTHSHHNTPDGIAVPEPESVGVSAITPDAISSTPSLNPT